MAKLLKFVLNDYVFPFFEALILCCIVFWPTILHHTLPMATDVLTGFHRPWMDISFPGLPFPFPYKNLESFDTVRQNFPWKYFVISQFKKGQWPLWNSSQLSGVPLGAEFIVGAYYPLNIILLVLPFVWGWGLLEILQVYLAFVTMYLFLRSLNLNKLSSTSGSVIFALSGFIAGFFGIQVMDHALLWTPLVLFGITKLHKTNNPWWITIIALGTAMTSLASHLQILLYLTLLTAGYILAKLYVQKNFKLAVLAFIGLGLGIALASIQIIPSLELLKFGARSNNFGVQVDDLLSPIHHLLLFWAPNYLGNPGNQNYFGGPSYYHEYSFYVGIPTLLFALIALGQSKKRKLILFWAGVLMVTLLTAVESPLSSLPQKLNIPFLASITPTRIYGYTDLALAILAALGLDMLLNKKWSEVKTGLIAFILLGSVSFALILINTKYQGILFLKYLFDTTPANNVTAIHSLIVPVLIFIITMVLTIFLTALKNKAIAMAIVIILMTLNTGDLIRQFRTQNGFVSANSVFPKTQITTYLSSQKIPPRIISTEDNILTPNFGAYYGWENIDGYQADNISDYVQTFSKLDGLFGNKKAFSKIVSINEPKSPVIDALGVDYVFTRSDLDKILKDPNYKRVLTEDQVIMYANKNGVPRFSFPQYPLTGTSDLELMTTGTVKFGKGNDISSITVKEYQPNYIILQINSAPNSQILQTMITKYPGWKATVNGVNKSLVVNKNGFIGVSVPKGSSLVKFYYDPLSFKIGLSLSLLSLILLIATPLYLAPPKRQ